MLRGHLLGLICCDALGREWKGLYRGRREWQRGTEMVASTCKLSWAFASFGSTGGGIPTYMYGVVNTERRESMHKL